MRPRPGVPFVCQLVSWILELFGHREFNVSERPVDVVFGWPAFLGSANLRALPFLDSVS